jgi:hypothetical protein
MTIFLRLRRQDTTGLCLTCFLVTGTIFWNHLQLGLSPTLVTDYQHWRDSRSGSFNGDQTFIIMAYGNRIF